MLARRHFAAVRGLTGPGNVTDDRRFPTCKRAEVDRLVLVPVLVLVLVLVSGQVQGLQAQAEEH